MTILITGGWLYLTNGTDIMNVRTKRIVIDDIHLDPFLEHFAGGTNMGFWLGERQIMVKALDIMFITQANAEKFIEKLNAWDYAGVYTLKIQVSGTPTYFKIDGVNESISVLSFGAKEIEKAEKGAGTHYKIASVKFEQAG